MNKKKHDHNYDHIGHEEHGHNHNHHHDISNMSGIKLFLVIILNLIITLAEVVGLTICM